MMIEKIEALKVVFGVHDDGKQGVELNISLSGVFEDTSTPEEAIRAIGFILSNIPLKHVHPAQADGDSEGETPDYAAADAAAVEQLLRELNGPAKQ